MIDRLLRLRLPGVWLLAASALVLTLAAFGCSSGAYPVDIFYEMHYQDSYGSQEPPRLSPPESAVAWFDPIKPLGDGHQLFLTNCSMCHGLEGQGNGNVLRIMESRYGYEPKVPPDLTVIQASLADETILDYVNNGIVLENQVTVMPAFKKLLSPHEIDLILGHVRTLELIIDAEAPVFIQKGCGACHTIEGMDTAVGNIGPNLTNIATVAATRVPGQNAEEYIRESILDPNGFIVPDCPTGPCGIPTLMPLEISGTMADQEFEELVEFLLSLQ